MSKKKMNLETKNELYETASNDKNAMISIALLSSTVLIFLVWLVYFKGSSELETGSWIEFLPALNAFLNTITSIALINAFYFIKRNNILWHKRAVMVALSTTALFLVSYITYHHYHGDSKFLATGIIRPIYFFILISHIVLSAIAVPMIMTTLYLAATKSFNRHRKIARFTFPVWLYVSVTGVLIFIVLKWFNA